MQYECRFSYTAQHHIATPCVWYYTGVTAAVSGAPLEIIHTELEWRNERRTRKYWIGNFDKEFSGAIRSRSLAALASRNCNRLEYTTSPSFTAKLLSPEPLFVDCWLVSHGDSFIINAPAVAAKTYFIPTTCTSYTRRNFRQWTVRGDVWGLNQEKKFRIGEKRSNSAALLL